MKFWLVRGGSIAAAIAVCLLIESLARLDPLMPRLVTLAGLYVTLAVSLNLINGITGQFSIGHAAFYQIGAYAAGFLTVNYLRNQQALAAPAATAILWALGLALYGYSLRFSPAHKGQGVRLAGMGLIVAAAGLLVLSWFVTIPYFSWIFWTVVAAAAWVRWSPEASKPAFTAGLGLALAGAVFYALFRFWPNMPNLMWLVVMIVMGAIASGVAGFVVGLPSLRLRGDYLAIVTLGFGEIIRIVVQNTPAIGGSYGLEVRPRMEYIWLVWLLAILCMAVCRNLLKTAHGLPFLSVREDEIASAAMGVNVTRVKVTAFVIGSAFAGGAGALLAHFEGFIAPTMFAMDVSFIILTMVVLGGTGSITGSAVAAVLLFYLPEKLRDLPAISGSSLAAAVVAVLAAIYVVKRIADHYHGPPLRKAAMIVGVIFIAVVAQVLLARGLSFVQPLREASFEAGNLRMVIFAATLIILMLLRPQGVFAHHEFSWSWVKKLFGRKVPETAVSA